MPPEIPLPTFLGRQIPLLLHKACLCSTLASRVTPFDLPLLANCISRVYTQKYSGIAASVTQPRLHGNPFPKNYAIAQSLCWVSTVSRVCWRRICFVPSLPVAERHALLSLHLHFVAQYNFFVIIIINYDR